MVGAKGTGYVYVIKPKVDAEEYNLALYYLAFYSKHELGNKFFKEIQKYHIPQQSLF